MTMGKLVLPLLSIALLASVPAAHAQDVPTGVFDNVRGDSDTVAASAGDGGTAAWRPDAPLAPSAADASLDPSSVLRVQVLLDRAHFSPGEIDGASGSNTRRATAAFQRARGLEPAGELDAATLAELARDPAPVLVDYTITAEDAQGPFAAIPADMMAKSKLERLGYASLEEMLGERFHASPRLLRELNPDKTFIEGEVLAVPNVVDPSPLPKAARVVVDESDASVSLVDAAGTTYARFPATSGSAHDPLPIGDWKIKGVARDPEFHYNPALFWDADRSHSKATVAPGPNNPVGVAWVDLSKEHYGIHGTPEPATIGKTQSHGCIRLTNWDVLALASAIAPGMEAVLQP